MSEGNTLTMFVYHGVTSEKSSGIENASGKHMDSKKFEDQMCILKKHCVCLSIDEVYEHYQKGAGFPKNAVAVTFDDGFRNNYTTAAPILVKHGIPAVFYLCSGVINTDLMFWVDTLEDAINRSQTEVLSIQLERTVLFDISDQSKKIQTLSVIKTYCKNASTMEKDRVIENVIKATGIEPTVAHAKNYEKLSWKEVQELDRYPLFTIGAHSLYHEILSKIEDPQRQKLDIQLSIQLLEYHLGHPVNHFSYPEGQLAHYNDDIISILKDSSIKLCPSAIDGVNDKSTNVFHLRRIMVGFQGKELPMFHRSIL